MAKVQSFADKMNKATMDFTQHCPECGESFSVVKLVSTEKSEETGAFKFREKFINVCKCNENSIM